MKSIFNKPNKISEVGKLLKHLIWNVMEQNTYKRDKSNPCRFSTSKKKFLVCGAIIIRQQTDCIVEDKYLLVLQFSFRQCCIGFIDTQTQNIWNNTILVSTIATTKYVNDPLNTNIILVCLITLMMRNRFHNFFQNDRKLYI